MVDHPYIHPTSSPPCALPSRLAPKARAGSFIAKLTAEQRAQLVQWLTTFTVPEVGEFVALPPPRGFGLDVHDMTLRRIKSFQLGASAVEYESSCEAAEALAETVDQNPTPFAPLISDLLLQKAFDIARAENSSHGLKDLINAAVKLRERDLKVQRVELQREQARTRGNRRYVKLNILPAEPVTPNETTKTREI